MANKTLNVTLIMRNDTAANWANKNPVLTLGELGVETDTRKFKIGDGTTAYNSLKYGLGGNVEVKSTAPTASDVGYDIGTLWVDTTGTKAYILLQNQQVRQRGSGFWTRKEKSTKQHSPTRQLNFKPQGRLSFRERSSQTLKRLTVAATSNTSLCLQIAAYRRELIPKLP